MLFVGRRGAGSEFRGGKTMATQTSMKKIGGREFTLVVGETYRASRPMADGRAIFTVSITNLRTNRIEARVGGLDYAASNDLLFAFNSGASSFDGRLWTVGS
jgi:hypothetical protein